MKFNKLIAKGLTLGLLLNSTSTLSYANTEIPNRYQTLEGEYVTLDDSMEGNLEEIEIFGNTIQDENNLEDIQSVGDLYVDEKGNPILDKQGREQYKIDIVSKSKNLIDMQNVEVVVGKGILTTNGNLYNAPDQSSANTLIPVNPGTHYTLSINNHTWVFAYDSNGNYIDIISQGTNLSFRTFDNCYYIKFCVRNLDSQYIKANTQLETGKVSTSYSKYKVVKTTILLPTQLQKVGDVADRLYWDSTKNKYIVDKYIREWIIDFDKKSVEVFSSEKMNVHRLNVLNYYIGDDIANIRDDRWNVNNCRPISDKMVLDNNAYLHDNLYGKDFALGMTIDGYLRLDISKEYKPTEKDAKDFVASLGVVKFLIIKRGVESIETNITSKLKIPTYNEKTHIYIDSENDINPTLKVTIDRLPQIAKEAVAQAENDNSNHNIALARRYINMLPESSYKDQLQEQLSNIFSSDMALDMKTATSNLDLYIKCENILQMSLDTNQISFDDFSGIEDVEKVNAVNLTINSSLPYQLNAYLPTEIQNSDKSVTMDKSILNIKENSESNYQTFANTTDKVILKDNCSAGNQLIHGVDLKLAGGIAHEKDVYKATIKLEAEQK